MHEFHHYIIHANANFSQALPTETIAHQQAWQIKSIQAQLMQTSKFCFLYAFV
jgi:hypothetical protein